MWSLPTGCSKVKASGHCFVETGMMLLSLIAAVAAHQAAAQPSQPAPERSNPTQLRPLQGVLTIRQNDEDASAQEVMTPRMHLNIEGMVAQRHMPYVSFNCLNSSLYSVSTDHVSVDCGNGYKYIYPGVGSSGGGSIVTSAGLLFHGNMWNVVYDVGQGGRLVQTPRACFARSFDLSNLHSDTACEALWAQRRSDFVQSLQWARENRATMQFIAVKPSPDAPYIIVDYRVR
jgi:hypothetical protein